jgi:hypothetical protein
MNPIRMSAIRSGRVTSVILVDLAMHGVRPAVGGVLHGVGAIIERLFLSLIARGGGLSLEGVGLSLAGFIDSVRASVLGILFRTAAGGDDGRGGEQGDEGGSAHRKLLKRSGALKLKLGRALHANPPSRSVTPWVTVRDRAPDRLKRRENPCTASPEPCQTNIFG